MKIRSAARIAFAAAALAFLPGCASMVVAGATAVGAVTHQEREAGEVASDLAIQVAIFENWIRYDPALSAKVDATVYNGRVLLTGATEDENVRADAVRLTWKVEDVRDVFNEIQLTKSGVIDLAKDAWVTTALKTRLTFDKDVFAINYAIETVNGIVYLIGIAQNEAELERVKSHARDISYVRKVISHVPIKPKDDAPAKKDAPIRPPASKSG